jgi:hypothetical protein
MQAGGPPSPELLQELGAAMGVSSADMKQELASCFEALTQSVNAAIQSAMDVGAARCVYCVLCPRAYVCDRCFVFVRARCVLCDCVCARCRCVWVCVCMLCVCAAACFVGACVPPPCRLFEHNMTAKALWHTYFCHSHSVKADEFVHGLRLFLRGTLHMAEDDLAALLSADNCAALRVALDPDGDGEVGAGGGGGAGGGSACLQCRGDGARCAHQVAVSSARGADGWGAWLLGSARQVSIMEVTRVLDKKDVPFVDLLLGACAAGRSGLSQVMRRHPTGALMKRFRDQVRRRGCERTGASRMLWSGRERAACLACSHSSCLFGRARRVRPWGLPG